MAGEGNSYETKGNLSFVRGSRFLQPHKVVLNLGKAHRIFVDICWSII